MHTLNQFFILIKARVLLLMISTAYVGLKLAPQSSIGWTGEITILFGIFCIAGAGAICNHIFDRNIDKKMKRTSHRPLAQGAISLKGAILYVFVLWMIGSFCLFQSSNTLTWITTSLGAIGYGVIYTCILKKASPQNIVWGGLSGALPPLLGWISVTNSIDPAALLLCGLIFTWTPPHFWALAIQKKEDYAAAGIPMLPITHGVPFTAFASWLYTLLLIPINLLLWSCYFKSDFFLVSAIVLTLIYAMINTLLLYKPSPQIASSSFIYSIIYLYFLFFIMLLDRKGAIIL